MKFYWGYIFVARTSMMFEPFYVLPYIKLRSLEIKVDMLMM